MRQIAADPNERQATRLQAALGLLRLPVMKSELPKHVLEEEEEASSLAQELKKLEGMTPEELTAEYEYLLSDEYHLAELRKKPPAEAIASLRLKKRETDRLENMNAEELMKEYKRMIDEGR